MCGFTLVCFLHYVDITIRFYMVLLGFRMTRFISIGLFKSMVWDDPWKVSLAFLKRRKGEGCCFPARAFLDVLFVFHNVVCFVEPVDASNETPDSYQLRT